MIIIFMLLGLLIMLTESSAVAPFIYTLFWLSSDSQTSDLLKSFVSLRPWITKSESEEFEFGDNLNVIIFQVLEERYLIEVENVKEIYVPGEQIIPVPLADKSIVGIINIRGDIYSIISGYNFAK